MLDLTYTPPTSDDLRIRSAARRLRAELDAHRLTVALVPAPNPKHPGHRVRQVIDRNPVWYRALCQQRASLAHEPRGKHDTAIKRAHVLSGLDAIANGRTGCYHDLLMLVVNRAVSGKEF